MKKQPSVTTFFLALGILFILFCFIPVSVSFSNAISDGNLYMPLIHNDPTLTPTPTPPPNSLEILLFADMNGSGLRDTATFQYDIDRFNQPFASGIDTAIASYLATHSGLQQGDLITIMEPGIPGLTVCAGSACAVTAYDGKAWILGKANYQGQLTITDLNSAVPALAFRYINQWNGPVVIPAYEINGAQVPEQHLNDTEIVPIANGIYIGSDRSNVVGLMQGFMTLPFRAIQVPEPLIFNYFDIVGIRLFDADHNYYNTQDGIMISYNGVYTSTFSPDPYYEGAVVMPGVSDSHNGLDILLPIGSDVLLGVPPSTVWNVPSYDGELLVQC